MTSPEGGGEVRLSVEEVPKLLYKSENTQSINNKSSMPLSETGKHKLGYWKSG